MVPQRDNRVKVSALLRAGHKVCQVANLAGVSRTTVYAINKRMDDALLDRVIIAQGGLNVKIIYLKL